jgi:oxygen-dependent protoporphyrinogen oxidase
LRLNSPVSVIEEGYKIHISAEESLTGFPTPEILEASSLILASPASVSARLLATIAPDSAKILQQIRYAGIASISLGYRLDDIPRPLDAYGVVIPRTAKRPIDGIQWNSAKWGKRAAEDKALLRVFFGGPHTRFMLEKGENEILTIVREELRQIMGITAEPEFFRIGKWENAYPQYDVGHLQRVTSIDSALPNTIALAGNAYYGVGVPDTVKTAQAAIEKLSKTIHS